MGDMAEDPPLLKLFRGCFQNCLPIFDQKNSEGAQTDVVSAVLNDVTDDVSNDVSKKKSTSVRKEATSVTSSLHRRAEDSQNDKKVEKNEAEKREKVCAEEAMDSSEPDQIGEKNGEIIDEEDDKKGEEFQEASAKVPATEPRLSSQSMSPTASDGESMLLDKDAYLELTNGICDHHSKEEHLLTSSPDDVDRGDDDVRVKGGVNLTSSDDDTAYLSASKTKFSVALAEMESARRVFCEDMYCQLNKFSHPKEIENRLQNLNLRLNSDSDVAEVHNNVDFFVSILERVVATVLLRDFFSKFGEELSQKKRMLKSKKDLPSYRRECLEEFERLRSCYDESLLKTDVSRKEFKQLTVDYFRKHEQFEGDVSFKQFTQEKNCALKESIEGLIDDIPDVKKRENALHSILGTDLSNKRITVHYLSLCKSVWRLRWFIQSIESPSEIAEMTKEIHSTRI